MPGAADPEARALAALDRLAGDQAALGVALSGGGDSTALLHFTAAWAQGRRIRLAAATVDHRLRPESGAEAAQAGAAAAALGIAHQTLPWQHPHEGGNLPATARAARLRLLGAWARDEGLGAVLLGHTRDDLGETLLMRLGRGAGLDGLSAMAERREAEGMVWLRPMLGLGRAELRGWLSARGIGWADDPTNDDPSQERTRARQAIAALGLDPARLAESASHLRAAREALGAVAVAAAQGARWHHGSLHLPRVAFEAAHPELRRLLLKAALHCVTGEDYPPRRDALAATLAALASGRGAAAGGALLRLTSTTLRVEREPAAAVKAPPLTADGVWDRRWIISGLPPGTEIRALGPAAPALDRRVLKMSRAAAECSPGLWRGGQLIAPLLPVPPHGIRLTAARALPDFLRHLGGS
ncbi:tRNA lysidine(34) synthetase TilS [Paracoccus sp. S-4012]|uniref:tRNA lysidine(34) synthetase TilS n=1 Tax=Paracoccus sp. S-4012 TaxID=2665648 RepID=UPI0012B096ED|nr:tRNA lysidine(34) synthetase TilS [Paracoccus sp. S-4012]MRX49154.1 tRNA lysidine(34) synthetase TilS [Paracoccus sp. S-4012]